MMHHCLIHTRFFRDGLFTTLHNVLHTGFRNGGLLLKVVFWLGIFGGCEIVAATVSSREAIAAPLVGRGRPQRNRPPSGTKSLQRGSSGNALLTADPFAFDFSSAVEVLSDSTELNLYDPITIATLRRLQEDATPAYDPRDIDPVQMRHVVEKAFAIQAGRSFVNAIKDSELGPLHRELLRSFERLQGLLNFSLSHSHDGLSAGQDPEGHRYFSLNVRMSAREGFDPQIQLSEDLRIRYDLGDKQTMLEYAFGF